MVEAAYIRKFERVVDLMRAKGTYTAVLISGTTWELTANLRHTLSVNDYIVLDNSYKVRVTQITSLAIFQIDAGTITMQSSGWWKALAPYGMYGTRKAINAKLLERNGGEYAYQKYPMIAFRLPATITKTKAVYTADANILIADFTKKTYKPDERIANKFEPILYPLRDAFLEACKRSGEFLNFEFDFMQIDRMFYGTEQAGEDNIANVFDDPLDAVELRDMKLKFIEDCTSSPPVIYSNPDAGFEYGFEHVFES
jgi:hypothetical protein